MHFSLSDDLGPLEGFGTLLNIVTEQVIFQSKMRQKTLQFLEVFEKLLLNVDWIKCFQAFSWPHWAFFEEHSEFPQHA